MPPETVIQVENLGKKYRLQHQAERQRYTALRDVLASRAKSFARSPISALRILLSAFRSAPRSTLHAPTTAAKTEDFWALKDVSFDVKQGEVVGIIGRNGAGKSTLLKILSRITDPTEGRVCIKGRVASLLEVGTGFHPELTGRENIFLNGAILGMTRVEIKKKFDEIVAFAEIERFLDTPVKRYSSGMYVRLAFAVAAHLEPEILIVDEVLAVGDAQFQKKCMGKMGEVAKGGRTVLFVSHNMAAIQELTSRAALLQDGRVVADGPTTKVICGYLDDAAASATGEFELERHSARKAGSNCLIRKLALIGEAGRPTGLIFPDERVAFEISIVAKVAILEPRIAVAIEDANSRRIMTMASYFSEIPIQGIQKDCKVRCVTGPLRLGPGRYLLSVSVGTKSDGLIDSIDSAAWFEVGWRNNYANGEPYHGDYGPILKSSSWEILTT